jgi:hypothetical protein
LRRRMTSRCLATKAVAMCKLGAAAGAVACRWTLEKESGKRKEKMRRLT